MHMQKDELSSSQSSTSSIVFNTHELALRSLCKGILKNRLFRGFYLERRRVVSVNGYRDIITLHRTEKELDKMLLEIKSKLLLFYEHTHPDKWVGITASILQGAPREINASETRIWTLLEDFAFGQYWFSIKGVRFRDNEVMIKVKVIRTVEPDIIETPRVRVLNAVTKAAKNLTPIKSLTAVAATDERNEVITTSLSEIVEQIEQTESQKEPNDISVNDFLNIAYGWGEGIKLSLYNFLMNDITKENIIATFKFIGLLIISIGYSSVMGIRYLGIFILHFLFELSRLTRILSPILLKIIDVFNKCIGGFYILCAMIWRDLIGQRNRQPNQEQRLAIEYNRPIYKSLKYGVRHSKSDEQFTSKGYKPGYVKL